MGVFQKMLLQKRQTILLIILAAIWFSVGQLFYINTIIDFPKFDFSNTLYTNFLKEIRVNTYYYSFLILDTIFIFFLLKYFYKAIKERIAIGQKFLLKIIFYTFSISGILTFVQNLCYFFFWMDSLIYINPIKQIFLLFSVVLVLYTVLVPYKLSFLKFIYNARISILFLIVLLGVFLQLDQGKDILIQLFQSPFNLICCVLLLMAIAFPTAHYPLYFKYSKYMDPKYYQLGKAKSFSLFSFGIIYFYKKKYDKKAGILGSRNDDIILSFFRVCLGLFVFVTFLVAIANVYDQSFDSHLVPLVLVFVFGLYYFLWYYFQGKKQLDDFFYKNNTKELAPPRVVFFIKVLSALPYLIVLIALGLIGLLVISFGLGWHRITVLYTVFMVYLVAFTYLLFQVGRSNLKYLFYTKYTTIYLEDGTYYINPDKIAFFRKYNHANRFNFLSLFSNNILYLRTMSIIGFIAFIALLYINCSWQVIQHINVINILLLYYLAYYGFFVIIRKHYLYYLQKGQEGTRNNTYYFWRYHLPFMAIFLSVIGLVTFFNGNDLHELHTYSSNENSQSLESFAQHITGEDRHFFVASCGGGMKSNIWTTLLLQKLETKYAPVFNSIRCLSGVSGGSVGISNYAYLQAENHQNQNDRIDRVASLNALSLDVTFLLGRDFIRELFPFQYHGKDRAYYGMHQYTMAMEGPAFNRTVSDSISFYDLYGKANTRKYFPPIIINTVSENGSYGTALSLSDTPSDIFPGSISILGSNGSESELSFSSITSTSNRFPFLSPSATISKRGHFLDGGIFDNSGLTACRSFASYLIRKNVISKEKVHYINIINSKTDYIYHFIQKHQAYLSLNEHVGLNEFSAVFNAAATTGMLPKRIRAILGKNKQLTEIYLPHTFSYQDLVAVLGGTPDATHIEKILAAIAQSNNKVIQTLKKSKDYDYQAWGMVAPALGRLLSKPSIAYEKAMLEHEEVVNSIQELTAF